MIPPVLKPLLLKLTTIKSLKLLQMLQPLKMYLLILVVCKLMNLNWLLLQLDQDSLPLLPILCNPPRQSKISPKSKELVDCINQRFFLLLISAIVVTLQNQEGQLGLQMNPACTSTCHLMTVVSKWKQVICHQGLSSQQPFKVSEQQRDPLLKHLLSPLLLHLHLQIQVLL